MSSHVYVKGDDAGGWRQAFCARVLEGVLVPHVDFCTRKKCSLLVQEPIRNVQCD